MCSVPVNPPSTHSPNRSRDGNAFPATHWSLVLAARDGSDHRGELALERLCQSYWPAIYHFILREVQNPTDAQDYTQEFFARLIGRQYLDHLIHQQGRFRSFLLAFVRHFLSDQRDRTNAQKRGGGVIFISLDQFNDETGRQFELTDDTTPEQSFERRWALALLDRSVNRLRAEYIANDQGILFDVLKDLQPGQRGPEDYAEIGARLNTSAAAVKSAVYRLRRRHREILREEISLTVGHPSEVDAEIRYLLAVLGS